MSKAVLDASVLLAILTGESFDRNVAGIVEGAVVSSVNWCEVLTKLADGRASDTVPEPTALQLALEGVEPFTQSQARIAAALREATRTAGLSLGDLACLALGAELDADIYTADRVWATLDLPLRIHVIR